MDIGPVFDGFSSWKGKTVAFIGDSITDGIGTTKTYHEILAEEIGFTALNYGVNGAQIKDMAGFAEKLYREHPETDAIFVFGGTNDYNSDIVISDPFTESVEEVDHDGVIAPRKKRTLNKNDMTFFGRVNILLETLKRRFPDKQIILMTPVHRGYAEFGPDNIQPDERYANACGKYIDDYVQALRRAADIWSVPLIDLYRVSGLIPVLDEHTPFFNNARTDRLHPNAAGHMRLARVIAGHMRIYPCF